MDWHDALDAGRGVDREHGAVLAAGEHLAFAQRDGDDWGRRTSGGARVYGLGRCCAEHCQVDNRQMGTDYICDWLAARLR